MSNKNPATLLGEGLIGGILGYATGLILSAFVLVFEALKIPLPLLALVVILDAILGIAEIYAGGIFYAVGVLLAGFIIKDLGTIVSGAVGLIIIFAVIFLKESE